MASATAEKDTPETEGPDLLGELHEAENQFRELLTAKLEELRPHVDAFERVQARLAAFDGAQATVKSRGPGRPAGSGRRRVDRTKELLDLVARKPGISIPDASSELGLESGYLYRVRTRLAERGQITVTDGKMSLAA